MRTHNDNPYSPFGRSARLLALAVLGLSLVGCGSKEELNLSEYVDELEFNNQLESLKEVSLGDFKISAATRAQEAKGGDRTWVEIRCKLYVVVAPEDESAVAAAYEDHRGVFNNMVIEVFRSSSIEELSDPRWATIKSRIADMSRPILGAERVRQIVADDFEWKPI